ncbi:MAG: hypothetical protein IT529_19370 [Burkholderiales bacterium]|nr:hypothetical protein [Burkholderiales bacterium]
MHADRFEWNGEGDVKADMVRGEGAAKTKRARPASQQRGKGKAAVSTSAKDRDRRFGAPRDEPRAGKGKAGREDIRKEARRVNVPRQSRRPGERSR